MAADRRPEDMMQKRGPEDTAVGKAWDKAWDPQMHRKVDTAVDKVSGMVVGSKKPADMQSALDRVRDMTLDK